MCLSIDNLQDVINNFFYTILIVFLWFFYQCRRFNPVKEILKLPHLWPVRYAIIWQAFIYLSIFCHMYLQLNS